jgi:shikimate kinase
MKIYLIGYMASGKTTRGKELAEYLNLPWLDLDELLVARSGRSISSWFAQSGEEAFREAEHELLHELAISPDSFVLATGGGTPVHFNNMPLMQRTGITVYLKVSEAELVRRLMADRTNRPLLAGVYEKDVPQVVLAHFHSRESRYLEAQMIWAENDTASMIGERITSLGQSVHSR